MTLSVRKSITQRTRAGMYRLSGIPKRFAQLNEWVRPNEFLVADRFTIADIALVSILINFNYGGQRIDAAHYPNLARYFRYLLDEEPVQSVLRAERPAVESVPGLDADFGRNP